MRSHHARLVILAVVLVMARAEPSPAGTPAPLLGIPEADAAFHRGHYQAAVAHAGNLARVRRVLTQAAAGEPIVFAVLGGSISAGSTLGVHNRRGRWLWHGRLFDWFNTTWPAASPHTHTRFNGAVPASTPAYVDGCLGFHLPQNAGATYTYSAPKFKCTPLTPHLAQLPIVYICALESPEKSPGCPTSCHADVLSPP